MYSAGQRSRAEISDGLSALFAISFPPFLSAIHPAMMTMMRLVAKGQDLGSGTQLIFSTHIRGNSTVCPDKLLHYNKYDATATVPGGDAECLTGNGIMGQIGWTGQCGLFGPLFHFICYIIRPNAICSLHRVLTLKMCLHNYAYPKT